MGGLRSESHQVTVDGRLKIQDRRLACAGTCSREPVVSAPRLPEQLDQRVRKVAPAVGSEGQCGTCWKAGSIEVQSEMDGCGTSNYIPDLHDSSKPRFSGLRLAITPLSAAMMASASSRLFSGAREFFLQRYREQSGGTHTLRVEYCFLRQGLILRRAVGDHLRNRTFGTFYFGT